MSSLSHVRERLRIAVCLAVGLAAGACNASIGGGDEESGSDQPDAGAGGEEDASPQQVESPDGGQVDELPPCDAAADDSAQADDGTCYYYVGSTKLAWGAAQDACVALGGHLAFVDSAEESVLLGTIAPGEVADVEAGLHDIWVGGTDSPTEGAWHWIDGTAYFDDVTGEALGYVNWRGVEPNNSTGQNPDGENCMIIEGDNDLVDRGPQWDDRSCLAAYPYICEVPQ